MNEKATAYCYVSITRHVPEYIEVKKTWSYTSTPPIRLHGWYLVKHSSNFTLTCAISKHEYNVMK
jgi:hypothetical protein